MKKLVCFLSCAAIIMSVLITFTQPTYAENVSSTQARILYEAGTGQVIYSQNAERKLPMASVTKVMALLLWAEDIEDGKLSLEDKVKATSYASSAEGSVIWLGPGEEMTAAELLEAVIMSSANDACIALAEHSEGSEAQFVKRMNDRAEELKMSNTRYTNCVGFDDSGHYSTAHDIAIVTAELMKHDVFRGWMLTWLDYLRGGETQLVNTNKLVRTYDGILGGKTGTTDNAGCCLTVCAERGDMRLIAVTLGCEDDDERFSSAKELLDYGFSSFEKFTPEIDFTKLKTIPITRGTVEGTRPIIKVQGVECVIKKGRAADVKYEYTFVEECEAPVKKGQFMGEYLVTLDGAEIFRSEIVCKEDIPKLNFFRCMQMIVKEIFS